MAEDPGSLKKPVDDASGVSELLEAFERAPSEYAQAVIIDEKLVPRIQNHGIHPPEIHIYSRGSPFVLQYFNKKLN